MTKDQILILLIAGARSVIKNNTFYATTAKEIENIQTIRERIDPDIDLSKIPLSEFKDMCKI